MKGSELTRRHFAWLAAAALGGLVAGSLVGCERADQPADRPVAPTPAEGQEPNGSGPREPNGSAPRQPDGPREPDAPREPGGREPQEPSERGPRDDSDSDRRPGRTDR